ALHSDVTLNVTVDASTEPSSQELRFGFRLSGSSSVMDQLVWPTGTAVESQRQDDLWESTCFELFIGSLHETSYYELNFSPSYAWNAYHFTSERHGMRVAQELAANPLQRVSRTVDACELAGSID